MLELRKVTRSWGNFALKDIGLSISKGEYFVLLGPCGAGKSLLLSLVVGIYLLDSGKIFLDNVDITDLSPEKRRIGCVFQKYYLFPHLSVKENIMFGLRYRKIPEAQKKDELQALVDLLELDSLFLRKDVTNLSGGETQKVGLARALAIKPKLLLLDEPVHSLDAQSCSRVLKTLKCINKEFGVTILHVTHDLNEADQLADRVGILSDGRLIKSGTLKEIHTNPTHLSLI